MVSQILVGKMGMANAFRIMRKWQRWGRTISAVHLAIVIPMIIVGTTDDSWREHRESNNQPSLSPDHFQVLISSIRSV